MAEGAFCCEAMTATMTSTAVPLEFCRIVATMKRWRVVSVLFCFKLSRKTPEHSLELWISGLDVGKICSKQMFRLKAA